MMIQKASGLTAITGWRTEDHTVLRNRELLANVRPQSRERQLKHIQCVGVCVIECYKRKVHIT